LKIFPMAPMGKLLTCLLRDSRLHNCEHFGQLQHVRAAETLKSSHCPHGKLTFCSFFAGRWCLCQGWHSVNCELPDLLQHSCLCARSSSKVPIAPMGIPANLPKSTLIFQFGSIFGSTRDMYVPATPANFPSPPWETQVLLVVCRAAVSLSRMALWPSHRAPSVGTQLHMCVLMFTSSHRPDGKTVPRWETHDLLVVCRAAVSMSMVAQCQS
jgi:hypothetical protein